MTFRIFERDTSKNMCVTIPNVTAVDYHFNNEFIVWTHNEEKTFAEIKVVKINPDTQWVSIIE